MKEHAIRLMLLGAALFQILLIHAQVIDQGFNRNEVAEMIAISTSDGNAAPSNENQVSDFSLLYRSQIVALDNIWELWQHTREKVAVISVQGAMEDDENWLSNFYTAMIPASGNLKISDSYTFQYSLADNPQAAVHLGWMVSMASMMPGISEKIDSLYQSGTKDYILTGYGQGGAITYLLTAHLLRLKADGKLPADIRFKTYCIAAPKPGNLHFAYAYEAVTSAGYQFNVVNSADWVPEVPLSVQTTDDFNATNPFTDARLKIKDKAFPERAALSKVYNGFDKPTRQAQEDLQKYLGNRAAQKINQRLPQFKAPSYFVSNNYVRTGTAVILLADSAYYSKYPDSSSQFYVHHSQEAYLYLLNQQYPKMKRDTLIYVNPVQKDSLTVVKPEPKDKLSGKWRLVYISRPLDDFNSMYPRKKPTLTLDAKSKRFSGSTGCNDFSGRISLKQSTLYFQAGMTIGTEVCKGLGELHFVETLKEVSKYTIADDGALLLQQGSTLLMRFKKM